MIIDQNVTIAAPPERVWDLMMNVPEVATCVPGVEQVTPVSDDVYAGILAVKLGPVGVRFEGRVTVVERDAEGLRARMDIEATDRRIRGAVTAKTSMKLSVDEDGRTRVEIHTDASIFGKLGQFGQGLLRKKADQVVAEFASNMAARLGSDMPTNGGTNVR